MKWLRAIVCALLLIPASADAFWHGSASSNFSGGKTQVNFNFIASNADFPFVDVFRNGGTISVGTAIAPPSNLDSNGFPLTGTWTKIISFPLPSEKSGDYIMVWTGGGPNTVMNNPGGTFVSGSLNGANGTYRFTPPVSAVNATTQVTVGVVTTGASYSQVTNLSVVNVNDFVSWQANPNAFSPQLLATIAAGRFGVIRFLNWQGSTFQGANEAMWTDWLSRKPVGYQSYSGAEYRANWWAGTPDNGGSGLDYTLTTPASPTYIFGNGAPVDKQIMHVQFNQTATFVGSSAVTFTSNTVNWSGHTFTGNEPVSFNKINNNLPTGLWQAQTYYVVGSSVVAGVSFQISLTPGGATISSFGTGASGNYQGVRLPTLNINGTGAFPIRNAYGDPPSSGDMPLTTSGGNPVYATMVFDGDFQAWCKTGGSTTDGSQGLNNGVPPELLYNLALVSGNHPWYVSSAFALDPMTNFWPTFAAYNKTNQPAWMIPRYEPVNEQWNFGAAFWNTRYGWNKAWFHWGVQFGTNQWQGKIASTMGQAISTVYGGTPDGTKYWYINGNQFASSYNTSGKSVTQNNERMTSATYVAQAAAPQSGYTKTAASLYTTHASAANYFGPGAYNTLAELQGAINYTAPGNIGNSAAQMALLNAYADTVNGPSVSGASILSLGSPGQLLWPSHGRTNGDGIVLYTTGALPTGLSQRIIYYAIVIDANTLELALTNGGTAINFTGSQSGTQTATYSNTNLLVDASSVVSGLQAFSTWAAGFTNNAGNAIGLTPYEGLYNASQTGASDASQSVSAATNATNAVVTVGSTTTSVNGSTLTGVGAQVGGAVAFSSIGGMTQINTSTFAATFAGSGSANITGTNSLILNQAVSFRQTNGASFQLPPEIQPGTPYYVVSIGNPFQISATRGGSALTTAGGSVGFGVTATPGWFVTNVSGQNITLDVDSTAFGTYTSGGTMTYAGSALQTTLFRAASRTATDLQGDIYGNTTPIPSMFLSFQNMGLVFPSKFQMSGSTGDPWGAIQPNIYHAAPTTGEWPAIQAFH